MSTVDSTFNSLATLWSTDIYSVYLRPQATDQQKIDAGRSAILFSLCTALVMGFILLYLKFDNPDSAFTHTLNNLRYYINCGIVVLICSAVLLVRPHRKGLLFAFVATLPVNILLQFALPEMNYFVRAFWVIIIGLALAIGSSRGQLHSLRSLFQPADERVKWWSWALALSLVLLHLIFH